MGAAKVGQWPYRAMLVAWAVAAAIIAHGLRAFSPAIADLGQSLSRRLLPTIDPARNILIAGISGQTPANLGFPRAGKVPRRIQADFVRKLAAAGAKCVTFDLEFKGADDPDNEALSKAISDAAPMPVVVAALEQDLQMEDDHTVYTFATPPVAPKSGNLWIGHTRSDVERGITLLRLDGGSRTVFHLAAVSAAASMGLDPDRDLTVDPQGIRIGSQLISTDPRGAIVIPDVQPRPTAVPFEDLLAHPELAKGKSVFVGITETTADNHLTPYGRLNGVTWVAMVAYDLTSTALPTVPTLGWISLAFGLVLSLATLFSILKLSPIRLVLGLGATLMLAWFGPVWIADKYHVVLDTLGPLMAVALTAAGIGAMEGLRARREVWKFTPEHIRRGRTEPLQEDATVMFVDLVDSTVLIRTLGETPADRVMNEVTRRLAEEVRQSGGEVERPLGDGVLVLWRGGNRHAQVQRCLDAIPGLMQCLLDPPMDGIPADFELRLTFGIEAGPVAGSQIEMGSVPVWMSTGATVNLAARLQGLCSSTGSRCLLGPNAAEVVPKDHSLKPLGELPLKGFEDPIKVSSLETEP